MAQQTLAQIQAEINGTNLADGQQIKQLLLDIVTFIGAGSATPSATLTAAGTVKEAANVAASTDVTNVAVQFNALRTAMIAAGMLVGP